MGKGNLRWITSLSVLNPLIFLVVTTVTAQIQFSQNGNKPDIIFDDAPTQALPPCSTPKGNAGFCKPLIQCAIFYAEIPSLLDNPCQTVSGQIGVCCPNEGEKHTIPIGNNVGQNGVLAKPAPPNVPVPDLSQTDLRRTAQISVRTFKDKADKITDILFNKKVVVPKGSPAESHQKFFTTTNAVLNDGVDAQLGIEASTNLVDRFKLSPLQGTFALPRFSARGTAIENTCPPLSRCNFNYPYRTIDGSCNNQNSPDWGKSRIQLQRILPPKYGDGVTTPRVQQNGQPLPSSRVISQIMFDDENRPYNNFTLMLMQWGQWMDHDLTHTPIVKGTNQTGISCCQNGRHLPSDLRHPDCFPIDIPEDDRFYSRFNQVCMEFVRSLPAPRRECNFGPRDQMNQITSYIDGSNIYGSTESRARSLRENFGGRLLIQRNQQTQLMPANPSECSSNGQFCFRAGDLRVNEQVELAVVHTLWLREHNRVANELQRLNPSWDDETLFQEARRIVVAELQHITYNEYLPLILGPDYMRNFRLEPAEQGHTNLYDVDVDATITNAFAAAAFRFGHSMIQGTVKMFNKFGASKSTPFVNTQFKPFSIYTEFDDLVRGLVSQESQRFDNFVSEAVTNHLFGGSTGFGLDLMSLNIQRGRDHGLAAYNDWRDICGLGRFRTWDDMATEVEPRKVQALSRVYSSVDEVDLFVGGMVENPLRGAVLGPTFVCIVGDQFARLRRGDRFYYEEQSSRFTDAQLEQLRRTSLARIICDNSNDVAVIQPLVFQQATFLNKRVPCNSDEVPKIDLRFWTERRRSDPDNGKVQFNEENPQFQGNAG